MNAPIVIPQSILFACTLNAVRSPMAEALARKALGPRVYVASAGLRKTEVDAFAAFVMRELDIDISEHQSQSLVDVDVAAFDLVVALSPEAEAFAREATRLSATAVEYWQVPDLSGAGETRNQRLEAFRSVRTLLGERIRERFPLRASSPDAR